MKHAPTLAQTAAALVADDKGLLAMDESTPTCNGRFARLGISATEETRRAYRELLVTTPGLAESISGVILYDETLHQKTKDGAPFLAVLHRADITAGIKVDAGAKALASHPDEKITEGLDGLRERLVHYSDLGVRFAKWRAVISIGKGRPSHTAIATNAHALARYAALCQEAGLVPVVEPEVLMEGDHPIERCEIVTEEVLHAVFHELTTQRVQLEGMLLKPNMVLAGLDCSRQPSTDEITEATVRCLRRAVPAAVPGIVFLSGGQTAVEASTRLNAMNANFAAQCPWALSFSFARAIQQPALELWRGHDKKVTEAQHALAHRAACNRAARRGQYREELEKAA